MSETLRPNLELVSVDYESNGAKAVMTFLDKDERAVRVVNFNKQNYDKDNKKFIADDAKAAKVDEWCKTSFNTTFEGLPGAIGSMHDVWVYDTFCSLWQCEQVVKFTDDMEGQIYQTNVKAVEVDNMAIRIKYDIDGKTYESKMSFGVYQEAMREWFVDPIKKTRQYAKFEEKFGVPVDQAEKIIGHVLMVECKRAMGKYLYGDIKKFPKTK